MNDRKTHWEDVYGAKSPVEVSWYQQKPILSLKLISDTGVPRNASVIDVGGGASTLVDELCSMGYSSVSVLDVSANALIHACERLGDKAEQTEWFEADITVFEPPRRFDLWHDRAVFHFLTDASDRSHYVATLKKTLSPGGHVIIMTFAVGGPKKCSGLDIVQYDAKKLLAELGLGFELQDSGHDVHTTPAGGEQKFAWFRLVYTPA